METIFFFILYWILFNLIAFLWQFAWANSQCDYKMHAHRSIIYDKQSLYAIVSMKHNKFTAQIILFVKMPSNRIVIDKLMVDVENCWDLHLVRPSLWPFQQATCHREQFLWINLPPKLISMNFQGFFLPFLYLCCFKHFWFGSSSNNCCCYCFWCGHPLWTPMFLFSTYLATHLRSIAHLVSLWTTTKIDFFFTTLDLVIGNLLINLVHYSTKLHR